MYKSIVNGCSVDSEKLGMMPTATVFELSTASFIIGDIFGLAGLAEGTVCAVFTKVLRTCPLNTPLLTKAPSESLHNGMRFVYSFCW